MQSCDVEILGFQYVAAAITDARHTCTENVNLDLYLTL